jgi:PAS domain-containing protein
VKWWWTGRNSLLPWFATLQERKRFEKEIAADKESLAVTLRSIEDGVITTDVQGKIIMINKAGGTAYRLVFARCDRTTT